MTCYIVVTMTFVTYYTAGSRKRSASQLPNTAVVVNYKEATIPMTMTVNGISLQLTVAIGSTLGMYAGVGMRLVLHIQLIFYSHHYNYYY